LKSQKETLAMIQQLIEMRPIQNIKEANKMFWTEEETRIEKERTDAQLRLLEEALSKDEEKGDLC